MPDAVLLVTDEITYTYADAARAVQRGASGLRAAGVDAGDRVLVVARNRLPTYSSTWFALMDVGAIQAPVNPGEQRGRSWKGSYARLSPLSSSTTRNVHAVFDVDDDGREPVATDPDAVAVMIPTSGTTARSKLVTHRPTAVNVMAGKGFPYWMRLTAADRLKAIAAAVPHQRAAYSTLGSIGRGRASSCRRVLGSHLCRLGPPVRRDRVQRDRGDARDPHAATGARLATMLDNPIRLCYTGPSPTRERQLEIEARFFGFDICVRVRVCWSRRTD